MKTTIKKGIGVITVMIFAVILTLSMASFAFASDNIEEANAPAVSQYHYDPILSGDSVFGNYCCFTNDAKFNTIDRDKYVKKGTLEKQIIKDTKTKFAVYGDHSSTKELSVSGVSSGLSKVKKAELTGNYKVIPIKLKVKDTKGNTATVKSTVILVYAKDTSSTNSSSNNNNNNNNNSSSTASTSSGTTGSTASTANKTAKKAADNAKKSTGKIEKKNDNDNNQTLTASTGGNDGGGQGGSGSDPLGIGLLTAAGLAALLFSISIIPDIGVIRWFNQKKALRMKI